MARKRKRHKRGTRFGNAAPKNGKITHSSKWGDTSTTKTVYTSTRTCDHWQDPFVLLDGLTVYASAWFDRPFDSEPEKKARSFVPDLGVYFDSLWSSGRMMTTPGTRLPSALEQAFRLQAVAFPWFDHDVPSSINEFDTLVGWILETVKDDKRIEIGCAGGHGRTGTMLACLLVGQGVTAGQAVKSVHTVYCTEAIETWNQIEFVKDYAEFLGMSQYDPESDRLLSEAHAAGVSYFGSTTGKKTRWDDDDETAHILCWKDTACLRQPEHDGPCKPTSMGAASDKNIKVRLESDESGEYAVWRRMNDEALLLGGETEVDPLDEPGARDAEQWAEEGRRWWEECGGTVESYRRPTSDDEGCAFPPCRYPHECSPEDGDCHSAAVAEMISDDIRER